MLASPLNNHVRRHFHGRIFHGRFSMDAFALAYSEGLFAWNGQAGERIKDIA
jgi:hypothetical protein